MILLCSFFFGGAGGELMMQVKDAQLFILKDFTSWLSKGRKLNGFRHENAYLREVLDTSSTHLRDLEDVLQHWCSSRIASFLRALRRKPSLRLLRHRVAFDERKTPRKLMDIDEKHMKHIGNIGKTWENMMFWSLRLSSGPLGTPVFTRFILLCNCAGPADWPEARTRVLESFSGPETAPC